MFGIGFWELILLVLIGLVFKFFRKAAIENKKESDKE